MPKNVFVLVASHKIKTDIKNENIKHLSGGVIFQINDYQLKADSAIVFNDTRGFEAFGNVVLTKNDTNCQNAQKAYYREDVHIITFNDKIVYDVEDKSLSAKSTAVLY
jgi:lipopolysaccharide assembly outer membrane protein LptD (OstA)